MVLSRGSLVLHRLIQEKKFKKKSCLKIKGPSFDIWCTVLSNGPLPTMFKFKPWVKKGSAQRGHFFHIHPYRDNLLILLKHIDCGYSLEPPCRGGSNEYPQSMFWAEMWKISEFFNSKIFCFWRLKFLYIWIGVFSSWFVSYSPGFKNCPDQGVTSFA